MSTHSPLRLHGLAGVLLVAVVALAALATVATPAHATVARGVVDAMCTLPGPRLAPSVQDEAVDQIGLNLRAPYVRFVVSWAAAEPARGTYDEAYLSSVDHAVQRAYADGLRTIITYTYVPEWASDRRFWTDNPYHTKGYDRRYAMKTDAPRLAAWGEFVRQMAVRWQSQVWGYECWNEPNLHWTLYPQATAGDRNYGARVYVKMLKAFSTGLRQGDPAAKRLAGATAPRGNTATDPLSARRKMTSPQRFARAIKDLGALKYFDGYTHHAYTPGGAKNPQPEAPPRVPATTVNLGNLKTLLRLFPKKPFYITEYGYQTAPCNSFTWQYFSQETQASYLRRAYAFAARYPQVKAVLWYLLDDWSPNGDPKSLDGFYTGLRTISGVKKLSWYVFAGGTHLTLTAAPAQAAPGAAVQLAGTLTSDTVGPNGTAGPIEGKKLVLQRRLVGAKSWTTLSTKVVTDAAGAFTATITMGSPASYRVAWTPVVTSSALTITTP